MARLEGADPVGEVSDRARERGRAVDHGAVDAGERGDVLGNGTPGIDQRLERVGGAQAANAHRADLEDRRALAREPRRLEVDDHEGRVGEVGVEDVLLLEEPVPLVLAEAGIQVFLDRENDLVLRPDGKPYGRQLVVRELDAELRDTFGNKDLIIVE